MYLFCMYTSDHKQYERTRAELTPHAISISIENAETVSRRTLQVPFQSIHTKFGSHPADAKVPAFSYHYRLFRATDGPARLIVSDWDGKTEPGAEVGEELMFNYIQIAPYLEDANGH